MVFKGFIKHAFHFFVEVVLHIIKFILFWVISDQNNDMTPGISQYYIWLPVTNKLKPLPCWYDSFMYKSPVPNSWFSFAFHLAMYNHLLIRCHCPTIWLPALPLSLDISLKTLIRELALYILHIFHTSNRISISRLLGPLCKESIQVRVSYESVVTFIFCSEGLLAPWPTPNLVDHPLPFVWGC
jgi:hypothetical protein